MIDRRAPADDRFRHHHDIDPVTGCWNWTSTRAGDYAHFSVAGTNYKAHRWSYERFIGPIPTGAALRHSCGNGRCVNPQHLQVHGKKGGGVLPTGREFVLSRINVAESGCWLWTGGITPRGYGYGKSKHAHRYSYEAFVGPIPDGLEIDHLCRVTSCVNPDHLEPVTQRENQRRRWATVTHCKWGHEFSPENTRIGQGIRVCHACRIRRGRESYARKKARRAAAEAGCLINDRVGAIA